MFFYNKNRVFGGFSILLKDLLREFEINVDLPMYLYDESFNEVFKSGVLSKNEDNSYVITAKTRKNIIHRMFIKPETDYPVIIQSELKNGFKNGVKFGLNRDNQVFIGENLED